LRLDTFDDMIELRFHNYASHYHLTQSRMQCLEVEDEIELAHILKEAIQRLDEDLYEVEEGER
jgi:4-diphosphocytidyl-2C-methyl-D-erythritol kinase